MKAGSRITLRKRHADELQSFLDSHPKGHERAAIIFFERLSGDFGTGTRGSDRYLAIDICPLPEEAIESSSETHVAFELAYFREAFRRCKDEALVFGFIHNHPTGFSEFSSVDEKNEQTLLQALVNRNGIDIHMVSMLLVKGNFLARTRHGSTIPNSKPARHITIVGENIAVHGFASSGDIEIYARQATAFGAPFISILNSMRIGIVGCGGTGSAVATLLARTGIGELLLIDDDRLEKSNLNRVRGARLSDVGKYKAEVLADFIRYLELPADVTSIVAKIDLSPEALDNLATCDLIFGCTDDQIGRQVLNAMTYEYLLPYIDIGLGGAISTDKNGLAVLNCHIGRISTILPEYGECLSCQGIIDPDQIRREYELRQNPGLTDQEAGHRYLSGNGGEQAPGIAPFTGATADMAVTALFNLLRPFWKLPMELRSDQFSVDFVKLRIASKERTNDPACPYCKDDQALTRRSEHRLGRPALGVRKKFV